MLAEARKVANSIDTLKMRPLLLGYIDDFVVPEGEAPLDFGNRFLLYHRMVDRWLIREAGKVYGITREEGWRVVTRLALHMARTGQKRIAAADLVAAAGLPHLPSVKIEARSLLNRTSGGREYQFAHATIQEFLLSHAVLEAGAGYDVTGIALTRVAHRFVKDGAAALGKDKVDLRGAIPDYPTTPEEWARKSHGIELVPITAGEFWMGSPQVRSRLGAEHPAWRCEARQRRCRRHAPEGLNAERARSSRLLRFEILVDESLQGGAATPSGSGIFFDVFRRSATSGHFL